MRHAFWEALAPIDRRINPGGDQGRCHSRLRRFHGASRQLAPTACSSENPSLTSSLCLWFQSGRRLSAKTGGLSLRGH